MIRLTHAANGRPVYVSPELVTYISPADDWTKIDCNDHSLHYVSESPQEVARKVLEWRLAMIDYHHDIPAVKAKAVAELVKLAGLEEPKDET